MAVLYDNEDVKAFLRHWGIDTEKMLEVVIKIPADDLVTVTIKSLKDVDSKELKDAMIEEYALVKLKND